MNAPRTRKQELQLQGIEAELAALLSVVMPRVAQTGELIFIDPGNLPSAYLPHWLPEETSQLFELSTSAVALREALGEPVAGSMGELFLRAVAENSDTRNQHRRGPRQLASWLQGTVRLAPFEKR